MAKASLKSKPKSTGTEEVIEFLNLLDHPLKQTMELLREIILSSNKEITEHIKWKGPSFCFQGDDRITFNLHKNEFIMIVFHKGATGKDRKGNGTLFKDTTGLLEWVSPDRAVIKFSSTAEVNSKKDSLKKVVNQWLKLTAPHP